MFSESLCIYVCIYCQPRTGVILLQVKGIGHAYLFTINITVFTFWLRKKNRKTRYHWYYGKLNPRGKSATFHGTISFEEMYVLSYL